MARRLLVVAMVVLVLGQFLFGGAGFTQDVLALGTPQIIVVDPPSPQQVGVCIKVRVKVNWDSDFRSMRIRFGNEGWQEEATPEFERTFCTSDYSPGWYTIRVEVACQGDNNWSSPTSAEASYQLTSSSVPPTSAPQPTTQPAPSCQITSLDIWPSPATQGNEVRIKSSSSCNTTVRAMRTKIDGEILYEIGAPSMDARWHTDNVSPGWHRITVEVAGQGDDNWAHIASLSQDIQVVSRVQPTEPPISSHFNTGDVIQIGPDVFVIVEGQRRLVPNPATLDALGITRDWVNNKGLSDDQLRAIPRGPDIPDVQRDPNGFWAFKNWIFPNNQPIVPPTAVPPPTQTPLPLSSRFNNGDVIQIGPDIFVMVNGERRLVPNPETLDALGITRDWVDNKGLSEAQLREIPRGPDIPDVLRDPGGFQSFKNWILPNTVSIVHPTATPKPPTPTQAPKEPTATRRPISTKVPTVVPSVVPTESQDTDWDFPDGWDPGVDPGSGWWKRLMELLHIPAHASGCQDLLIPYQCTWFVAGKREDVCCWIGKSPRHAYLWDDRARDSKCGVRVSKTPSIGSIVVWEQGCADADWRRDCSKENCYGHVAYVTAVYTATNSVLVEEMNWADAPKGQVNTRTVKIEDCMSFVSRPSSSSPTPTLVPTPTPTQSTEDSNLLERFFNWLKSLLGR